MPPILPGSPHDLGAVATDGGVNFALFSAHATAVDLCLFRDGRETRLRLPARDGDIWHGFVPGLGVGEAYGFRVHGPWAPQAGHRFNPAKLLIDPYARMLDRRIVAHPAMRGDRADGHPCMIDSAPHVPRALVCPAPCPAPPVPARDWAETVIAEAHLKGLTRLHPTAPQPGSYAALTHPPVIAHLRDIGTTALELLPVQAFIDDPFVLARGLVNYWGYQPIAFFAPEPRYGTPADLARALASLHEAGLEVILDMVFNHSGEGDATGPTLCFRGIDNASYYRLGAEGAYVNDTGCGNTLNTAHPMVLRLVLDALRHWIGDWGVDGVRFDLGATLGRDGSGAFDRDAPLLAAMRADPVIRRAKLIMEPWDIGPGGYRLGGFPAPFAEWNDRFRDAVRRFWRGDAGAAGDLAAGLLGAAQQFDHSGRRPQASVNFITAHDGFTLHDLTAYARRHNAANGEDGRDGHGENFSDNCGVEGPTDDPGVGAVRQARAGAMMATLMLAQGTPMLLAGDALGQTQQGNNNAYAQDNAVTWLDWSGEGGALHRLACALARLRAQTPLLRQPLFLHGAMRSDGRADVRWWHPDGRPMQEADWQDPACLCLEIRGAAEAPADLPGAVLLVLNRGPARMLHLPPPLGAAHWQRCLDTVTLPDDNTPQTRQQARLPAAAVTVFKEATTTAGPAPREEPER